MVAKLSIIYLIIPIIIMDFIGWLHFKKNWQQLFLYKLELLSFFGTWLNFRLIYYKTWMCIKLIINREIWLVCEIPYPNVKPHKGNFVFFIFNVFISFFISFFYYSSSLSLYIYERVFNALLKSINRHFNMWHFKGKTMTQI